MADIRDKDVFASLYRDYLKDLAPYNRVIKTLTEDQISGQIDEYFCNKDYDIRSVMNNSGEIIGFCIIGMHEKAHPLATYHIAEMYVKREFRRKGYGFDTAIEFIRNNHGIYTFDVLEDNIIAHLFWKQVFKSAGGEMIAPLPEIRDNLPPGKSYAYVA